MRFQYAVVIGLGWLLAVVVGCTSGESKRISGLSTFVPRFAFDSLDENSEVANQARLEGSSEGSGSLAGDPPGPTRNSLKNSLPQLPWKRKPSEHVPDLHGSDLMSPLTEKEKAELGIFDRPLGASFKSPFRVGKAEMFKISKFWKRSIQANEEELNERPSMDALLADADVMSAVDSDSFAEKSVSADIIVLRATPNVRAFQQPDRTSPASLSLIQPRDRSLKVGDDVSIRSLPHFAGNQAAPPIEPPMGLPASSLSWRERLQKYPVTQDQRSSSVATLIQPEQTEFRILRMTAITPEDRSVRIDPQVNIRGMGRLTVVRGVHPDALQSGLQAAVEVAGQAQSNRSNNSNGQSSQEKTFNR